MKIDDLIDDPNVLNIYPFGSRVYGTHGEKSDFDYICVTNDKLKDSLLVDEQHNHYHMFALTEFDWLLSICDIQALECNYLPSEKIIKHGCYFPRIKPALHQLRISISTITSNSWVKGKKKLIVTGDYDKYIGMKSVFHSLRILDLGIQIARYADIKNYSSLNHIWADIQKLGEQYDRNELWEAIDTKYRKLFKSLSSEFKSLCPKDLTETDKKTKIKKLLIQFNVYTDELYNELIELG